MVATMMNDKGQGEDLTRKIKHDEEQSVEPENPELSAPPEPAKAAERLEEDERPRGWREQLTARLTRPPDSSREAKSGERTRGLVILAGTTVVCIFLFFGLFTTDSSTNRKDRKMTPSLGRPESAAVNPETANRSPVPQLSVNQQPNEEPGELSEKDVLGTMRNRGTQTPAGNVQPQSPKSTPGPNRTLSTVNFEDPALAEAYRRQGLIPPTQRTRVADWNEAITDTQPKQNVAPPPAPTLNLAEALRESSIVFVRSGVETSTSQAPSMPAIARKTAKLLPQGTALVARLQHSISSAAKVPVTAVIEYNYEENGQLVVPAGAKAYGELSQATPQGWVTIKFHTLEFPNGQQEEINGSAISMERTALRGDVNGKNGAKKFLTRTLTGVGTIAAFAVGGRGLTGGIDNSVLLRERIASNVALAGEQELAMLAYQQNIVVTLPANTRFYLVLHEAGVNRPATSVETVAPQVAAGQPTAARSPLSEPELREMVQLRNELREMNRLMQLSGSRLDPTVPKD